MANNNLIDFKKISLSVTLRILVLFALTGLGACASTGKEASSTVIVKNIPPNASEVNIKVKVKPRSRITVQLQDEVDRSHRVKKGESLWVISGYESVYNDSKYWGRIYNANKNIIRNPNRILPGQNLVIPHLTEKKD